MMLPETASGSGLWLFVAGSMTSVTFIVVLVIIIDLSRAVCPTPLPCFCLGDDVIDCAMMWFEELPYFLEFGASVWKELNLSENVLSYLPNKAFWGVKVRSLKLSRNMISEIEVESFRGSSGVTELDLSSNRIESLIPGTLAWLPLLKTLKLQFNRFKRFHPDSFAGADPLEILDLQGNDLTSVPTQALRKLPGLRRLSLRNNRIGEIHPLSFARVSPVLQFVDLGDNRAPVTIHRDAFCGLEPRPSTPKGEEVTWSGLNVLLLDHNGIRKFDLCFVRGVWTLKIIDVSGNPLLCDCSTVYLSQFYSPPPPPPPSSSPSSSSSSSSSSIFPFVTSSTSMVPPHVASSILLASPSFSRTTSTSPSTLFPGAQCESPPQFAGQFLSNFSEPLYRRFCPNHPAIKRLDHHHHHLHHHHHHQPRQRQHQQQQQQHNSGFQLYRQQEDEQERTDDLDLVPESFHGDDVASFDSREGDKNFNRRYHHHHRSDTHRDRTDRTDRTDDGDDEDEDDDELIFNSTNLCVVSTKCSESRNSRDSSVSIGDGRRRTFLWTGQMHAVKLCYVVTAVTFEIDDRRIAFRLLLFIALELFALLCSRLVVG